MREGYSKVRNEALAMAFSYMHLIERWGTGMLRVAKMIKEAGLGELEILGGETELRFNIYRKQAAGQSAEMKQDTKQAVKQAVDMKQDIRQEDIISSVAGKIDLSQAEVDILRILVDAPKTNMRTIAERLGLNITKVFRLMDKLRSKKMIERVGSSQKGYWKVLISEKTNG